MKTKHFLYSLALVGAFTACAENEYLAQDPAENTVANRPTVKNVTLTVEDGVEGRMAYDNKFTFTEGDKMAALLMDESNYSLRGGNAVKPAKWNELSWLERYTLVDYVHTNYPFEYDGEKWSANANMLEGNYFFTYPYMSFNGQRQPYYDITNQAQVGNTREGRSQALANNQFFIGYVKLDAGTGVTSVKTELTPVLCPLRINLESHLDHEVTINKIVLHQSQLYSQLTLDPTRATYAGTKQEATNGEELPSNNQGKWNLNKKRQKEHFNYANFLAAWSGDNAWTQELYDNDRYGSTLENDYVYNIKPGDMGNKADKEHKAGFYYYSDAIRKVVTPLQEYNDTDYATAYAQLYLKDSETAEGMVLKQEAANAIGAIIMVPAFETTKELDDLYLTVYTNEGVVRVNISNPNANGENQNVQTLGSIIKATPEMSFVDNKVTVVLNAGAITRIPTELVVNEANDLEKYVDYIAASDQNQLYTAQLNNDVVINDQIAAKILGLKNSSLRIVQKGVNGNNIVFATTEATANVLDKLEVAYADDEGNVTADDEGNVTLEVANGGVLNLSQTSKDKFNHDLNFVVNEGGTLNIVGANAVQGGYAATGVAIANKKEVSIINKGTLNVSAKQAIGIYVANYGTMSVAKDASIYMAPRTKNNINLKSINDIKGTIIVEAGATLSGTQAGNIKNEGVIKNFGSVMNINNKANESHDKVPGRVFVETAEAYTHLDNNTGAVIYDVLNPVRFNNNSTKFGTLFYTGKGVKLTDLNAANVTNAVITSGTLVVDKDGNSYSSTLKNLTVTNDAVITSGNEEVVATLPFASELAKSLVLEGNSTVDNVIFVLNATTERFDPVKTPAENAKIATIVMKGNVTLDHTVNFLNSYQDNDWATVTLYDAHAEVTEDGLVKAGKLVSVAGITSDIHNLGQIGLYDTDVETERITISSKPVTGINAVEKWTNAISGSNIADLVQGLKNNTYKLGDAVTISGLNIDNSDDCKYLLGKLAGKNVTLGGTTSFASDFATSFSCAKLILKTSITLNAANDNVTITVNSLKFESNTKMTINKGMVKFTGTQVVGMTTNIEGKVDFDSTGKNVYGKTASGEELQIKDAVWAKR